MTYNHFIHDAIAGQGAGPISDLVRYCSKSRFQFEGEVKRRHEAGLKVIKAAQCPTLNFLWHTFKCATNSMQKGQRRTLKLNQQLPVF